MRVIEWQCIANALLAVAIVITAWAPYKSQSKQAIKLLALVSLLVVSNLALAYLILVR